MHPQACAALNRPHSVANVIKYSFLNSRTGLQSENFAPQIDRSHPVKFSTPFIRMTIPRLALFPAEGMKRRAEGKDEAERVGTRWRTRIDSTWFISLGDVEVGLREYAEPVIACGA